MTNTSAIAPGMAVIGADGAPVGTVDRVEEDRIKLTKHGSTAQVEGASSPEEHHRYISLGLVAEVEGDSVRLSATGANALLFEEGED